VHSRNYATDYVIILDVSNGLAIKGPPIVVDGDDITIECGASKYNYNQNIKWIYRDLNNVESPVNDNKSENIVFQYKHFFLLFKLFY